MTLALLLFGTLVWFAGWTLDVGTTWRGILRAGTIALERNPLARALFRRFGVRGGFAVLALLEWAIVAAHWGAARLPCPGLSPLATVAACAASLATAGVFHALAARANHTGRIAPVLLPILRAYEAMGRRWPGA